MQESEKEKIAAAQVLERTQSAERAVSGSSAAVPPVKQEEEIPVVGRSPKSPAQHYNKNLLEEPKSKDDIKVFDSIERARNANMEEDQSCCACKLFWDGAAHAHTDPSCPEIKAEKLAGRKDNLKMVVIGNTNVGKTALIN